MKVRRPAGTNVVPSSFVVGYSLYVFSLFPFTSSTFHFVITLVLCIPFLTYSTSYFILSVFSCRWSVVDCTSSVLQLTFLLICLNPPFLLSFIDSLGFFLFLFFSLVFLVIFLPIPYEVRFFFMTFCRSLLQPQFMFLSCNRLVCGSFFHPLFP